MADFVLPLQPGRVRLMLIRDIDAGTIVDAEVFGGGDEAVRARANLQIGLDGELRDCPVSLPGFIAATDLREHLTEQAAIQQELGDGHDEMGHNITSREHWAKAEALRDLLKYLDHELETTNA